MSSGQQNVLVEWHSMFIARLECKLCGFSTEEFVYPFVPDCPYWLIFQEETTYALRFEPCDLPPGAERMSDPDWDQLRESMIAPRKRPGEKWIDIWVDPKSFRIHCPSCREIAVCIELDAII
jgi:hypothetical protein